MITESARAPGAGVHGIDHFMLDVPDLDEARRFVESFGLRVETGDDELRVRASGDHVWCRLRGADRKRLAYVSLGCFASDFAGIRERARAAKVEVRAAPSTPVRPADEGFWFLDPDGNTVQVKVAPKVMPDAKTSPGSRDFAAGQRWG
jgi:catechol 2,3-dioxygenase-like lactoylglutathione lyase family enzyme